MTAPQVFILSPARLDGQRGKLLLSPRARFALAQALRQAEGAPLGDVFSFLSGLYFRGKLTYATAFARPPRRAPPILVITTHRGLWSPSEHVGRVDLESFSRVDLAAADDRFLKPLHDDARALNRLLAMTRALSCWGESRPASTLIQLLEVLAIV